MDELDPATAASLEDLTACLNHIHLLADKPTYRALEQQTAHKGGFLPGTRLKRVRLTRTIVSDVLLGRKFPGKAFLLTFVDACGIDLENDRRWGQAWDRLAAQDQQVAARRGRRRNFARRTKNYAGDSPRPSTESRPPKHRPIGLQLRSISARQRWSRAVGRLCQHRARSAHPIRLPLGRGCQGGCRGPTWCPPRSVLDDEAEAEAPARSADEILIRARHSISAYSSRTTPQATIGIHRYIAAEPPCARSI